MSTPASTETPAQPEEKPLAIRKEPAGVTADEGETVQFKVEAEGGKEPYTYQWSYKNSGLLGYKQVSDTLEQKGSKTDLPALSVCAGVCCKASGNAETEYHLSDLQCSLSGGLRWA